jgi:hypothetical protein
MAKNTFRWFVLVAVAIAAGELQTNPTGPVPSGTSRPFQAGYVLKRVPLGAVHPRQAYPRQRLWESTSGNWSGYAVPLDTSKVTDTFSYVEGTWTVPAVTGSRGSASYAATWVGLDGYTDGTVEQIGTLQEWDGREQQNYAWFEMYPGPMYEIEGFPVNPGDSIAAQVTYEGNDVFKLTITNLTRAAGYVVPGAYTTSTSTMARSSAEWIVEAPSTEERGRVETLPLAEFGTIGFSNCYATGGKGTGAIGSLWAADPLTMINPNGGEALPSSLPSGGSAAFTVTWAK